MLSQSSLRAFARDRFFNDEHLARECGANAAVKGLLRPQFWVSTCSSFRLGDNMKCDQLLQDCVSSDVCTSSPTATWSQLADTVLQRELGQLILKRFLLFVLLLERLATSGQLPANVPLMFRLDSPIKSSKEVRHVSPCAATYNPCNRCNSYQCFGIRFMSGVLMAHHGLICKSHESV